MKDLRRFGLERNGKRIKVWGWKKAFQKLQFNLLLHHTFRFYFNDQLICETRWDGEDEWQPYRCYFSRNIPKDLYRDIVRAITEGYLSVPGEHNTRGITALAILNNR